MSLIYIDEILISIIFFFIPDCIVSRIIVNQLGQLCPLNMNSIDSQKRPSFF